MRNRKSNIAWTSILNSIIDLYIGYFRYLTPAFHFNTKLDFCHEPYYVWLQYFISYVITLHWFCQKIYHISQPILYIFSFLNERKAWTFEIIWLDASLGFKVEKKKVQDLMVIVLEVYIILDRTPSDVCNILNFRIIYPRCATIIPVKKPNNPLFDGRKSVLHLTSPYKCHK